MTRLKAGPEAGTGTDLGRNEHGHGLRQERARAEAVRRGGGMREDGREMTLEAGIRERQGALPENLTCRV